MCMLKHLAIIADGNRRWAKRNGLPKAVGYQQALITVENCCEWAISRNIDYLTIFAFSSENWKRTDEDIDIFMTTGENYYSRKDWYINKNIKVQFIGRKDRLKKEIVEKCSMFEKETKNNTALTLNICLDYGGRYEIEQAIAAGAKTVEEITNYLNQYGPEPDVILRTGGEKRLSNFLMWQSAYSEFEFLDILWPDFKKENFYNSIINFQQKNRRFGGLNNEEN